MIHQLATQTLATESSAKGGILQRKCNTCSNQTLMGGECKACAKKKSPLQRKLTIGSSHDPLEQEADRIADQVMATSVHSTVGLAPSGIQRFTGQVEEADTAPASVDRVLASAGHPLEASLQKDMGQRFGHDFSRVRVHTGAAAEQSAQDVNAHAYTVGRDIVFGAGQYAPQTHQGQRLLAHELTHVVQQGAALSAASTVARSKPKNHLSTTELVPGTFSILLQLPSSERWIGPPRLQDKSPSVGAIQAPAKEEEVENIKEESPKVIARSVASSIRTRLQRRATFTNPTPVAQDPFSRLVAGGTPGLTTPKINGAVVSTSADVLQNISPTNVTGTTSGGSTTCQFDPSFVINTSANVIVASSPGAGGWTGSVTPAFIGSPPACSSAGASIPTVMIAKPSNANFVTRVRNSEQEHVTAIQELHNRHFVPYDRFLMGLRGTGATLPDCGKNLVGQLGQRPTESGFGFVLGYAAETERLDGPGGTHSDTATVNIASGCSSVTLTLGQNNPSISGASRGNVVTVAPTVTNYDPFLLSVSGNNVVETAPGAGSTGKVIHRFSSPAQAAVGLHVFVHYGTTSKNAIGPMTYLLLAGKVAPAGSGAALKGVTEENIDPARFQVTLGVPGATDWAITQVDGNNVRTIINFSSQRDQAFSAVEILRGLGVTKLAFIGSRSSPELMFFKL